MLLIVANFYDLQPTYLLRIILRYQEARSQLRVNVDLAMLTYARKSPIRLALHGSRYRS